ncbi:hypothetical protein AB0J72_21080 [Dactylosporangium sp. NPDC049742]|uniref:hypothetical protein n=1 Tax=Dactylosporangium sp. NPDC049742 TaxID=3154737 RepID=UPI00342C5D5E
MAFHQDALGLADQVPHRDRPHQMFASLGVCHGDRGVRGEEHRGVCGVAGERRPVNWLSLDPACTTVVDIEVLEPTGLDCGSA